ncbi:hypothetical protein OIO90_003143 [Microbotryomycetes sp. JL221]|nr:hypothetical protein OIO90_003143 [Microbotryomycetes sp. JL221]
MTNQTRLGDDNQLGSLSNGAGTSIMSHTPPGSMSGRRSVRSASVEDPLLSSTSSFSSTSTVTTGGSGGEYAVYQAKQRTTGPRSSFVGSTSSLTAVSSNNDTAAQQQPPSPASSAPFAPTSTSSIPPLVSRPSNSTLPAPSGRAYARSISEAQERLKAQVLIAELQSLGLASDSAGAAIVQKLASVGQDAQWQAVNAAISSGKVVLLLPSEKLLPTMQITSSFLSDHLAYIEGQVEGSSSNRAFVTLGGFRGWMAQDELVFASAFSPTPLSSVDVNDSETRALLMGPGHPTIPSTSFDLFPSTMLVSNVTQLSIPRSGLSTVPGNDSGNRISTGARLAALFTKPLTSDVEPSNAATDGSSHFGSVSNTSGVKSQHISNLEAQVIAVGKIVRHGEIMKGIVAGSQNLVRQALQSIENFEDGAAQESLVSFVLGLNPPTKWSHVEEVTETYQNAMESIGSSILNTLTDRKREETATGQTTDVTTTRLTREDEIIIEESVTRALETVEDTITSLLYDKLFAIGLSDDFQQDENLSSRIAALNVLEISLEHLGLDLGDDGDDNGYGGDAVEVRDAIDDIMHDLGREFEQLQKPSINTPKRKLEIFVNLHKIIVDHLSRMTVPIKLKKDADATVPSEVEMDDTSQQSSRTQSGITTPNSPTGSQEAVDRTPRRIATKNEAQTVPELELPNAELSSSMHEATSTSVFDRATSPTLKSQDVVAGKDSSMPSKKLSPSSSSSADLILPLLIYACVKHNPRLASHLKFVQRFRTETLLRGEASYCLTNVSAVIEFLNHVDISTLGLDSQKVLAYSQTTAATNSNTNLTVGGRGSHRLTADARSRSRRSTISSRSQDLDRVVDTANQALVKAADMLFGPRGFAPRTIEDVKTVLDGAAGSVSKARGSLLRRATNASIVSDTLVTSNAGLGVSDSGELKGAQVAAKTNGGREQLGQREMLDLVSGSGDAFDAGLTTEYSTQRDQKEDDNRSMRSVSSLLSNRRAGEQVSAGANTEAAASSVSIGNDEPAKSFGDRLASIPGLSRFGSSANVNANTSVPNSESGKPTSSNMTSSGSRSSIFGAFAPSSPTARRTRISSVSSTSTTTNTTPLATPTAVEGGNLETVVVAQKFVEMSVEDLKVKDVAELLVEYKKLAAAVAASRK